MRVEPNGFQVHLLNHSDTAADEQRVTQLREPFQPLKIHFEKIIQKNVRRPGIEPGSTAWKATMLTITPPTPC